MALTDEHSPDTFRLPIRNYHKVIISKKHDLQKVKRIIRIKDVPITILESDSVENNLKTLYLAQKLMQNKFIWLRMHMYKGDLLRVILSQDNGKCPMNQ